MIKILADRNLYKLDEFLPVSVETTRYNPQKPLPPLKGVNAWLIRTVTKINQSTFSELPNSLKFVGTASSGSDHVDTDFLHTQGITFADAKGCNARAVAEYVITALLILREQKNVDFSNMRIGIIGVGAVGSAVNELLLKFGCTTVLFDPPREQRDAEFSSASEDEILACDILTFHVPYTEHGAFPTRHWLNRRKLVGRSYQVIINAARGGVIDEKALLEAYQAGHINHMIIDVWEHEPDFNPKLAEYAFFATPHIAGYSEQAKINATRMVCQKMNAFFELTMPENKNTETGRVAVPEISSTRLDETLLQLHPIGAYDRALRAIAHHPQKKELFATLRTNRPYRYEYEFLDFPNSVLNKFPELAKLTTTQSHST